MNEPIAIVGVAEVDTFETRGRSPVALMAIASKLALEDAGLTAADVDGLFTASSYYYMPSLTLGEYLGVTPGYADSTMVGGASFVSHLGHATAAISAGMCDVALIAYGSTQRTDRGKLVSMAEPVPYEVPFGLLYPTSQFALIAARHMAEYGTTSEQLAAVAVSARAWAGLNPNARYRDPLTVDDVLSSPMISSPLHKYDCCLVTDGGGALVVTSAERAASLRSDPVFVVGTGEAQDHRSILAMRDLTSTAAVESSGRAFERAGLDVRDIDVAYIYDAFTITVLILLEDLGFCPKGEAGRLVAEGGIAPGGRLPVNTNGGGLSYTHPGMLSLFLLIESVRQLRSQAGERQVDGAHAALVHGMGGTLGSHATAILSVPPIGPRSARVRGVGTPPRV